MKDFLKEIKERTLIFDGSKGYMLQKLGMKGGECPELWNVTHGSEVKKVYSLYKEAGADVIQTNTFQGSRTKLAKYGLEDRIYELNFEGARLAREVMNGDGFVAASIGPLGKLMEPAGELTFEEAYQVFREQVKAVVHGGVDLINFETFTDIGELRAAYLAARDVCKLPVACSLTFESNGRTLMGTDAHTALIILRSMGVDVVGTNCSFGPDQLLKMIQVMAQVGGVPLCAKPNAGIPELVDGETVYRETPEHFAELAEEFVRNGVRLIGGCCGTTPEFIRVLKKKLEKVEAPKIAGKSEAVITSGVRLLDLDEVKTIKTGRMVASEDPELRQHLAVGDMEFVVDRSMDLASEGNQACFFQVDAVEGRPDLLARVVDTAQGYLKEPFVLETANPEALAKALRIYRGKAGVVLNGYSYDIISALVGVAERYGCTIVDKSRLG